MSKRSRSPRQSREPLALVGYGLIWALVLAVPLVVSPTALDSFRLPKLLLAEWLGLASLASFALAAALGRGEAEEGGLPPWRRRVLMAAVPLALVATLGLATTEHPEHVRQALADLWIGVACLVGWSLALSSKRLGWLLGGLGVSGSLLALLGILQYHDLYRPFGFARGEEAGRLGVSSLAGNTGDLAAFLVLPVLVAQWRLAAPAVDRRGRLLWGAVLALCLYGLAVTQTLTGLVAVLVGSVVLWAARLRPRQAVAAGAGALLAVVLIVLAVAPLRERVARSADFLAEGKIDALVSGRLDGWRAALWMVGESPVLGVGHGAYRAEFARAKLALLDEGVELYPGHVDPFFANAHNELLEAGAEWGILGWVALGWALWLLGRAVARGAARRSREDRGFALGALAAVAVLALGQFPFRFALAAYPILLLGAWLFRVAAEDAPEPGAPWQAGGPRRLLAWAVTLALALALVGQTVRSKDRIGASKRLRVVDVVTAQAVSATGEIPRQILGGNLRLLRQARTLDPADVTVPASLAAQHLLAGSPRRAVAVYEEAIALEPRPELYLNLGRALLTIGERERAVEAFSDAVRLAPRLRSQVPSTVRRELPKVAKNR